MMMKNMMIWAAGSCKVNNLFGRTISKNSKFSGQDVINLKNRHLEDVPLKELKKITKQAINYCLDGNDLASREIFKKLMR